ncbi:MAG: GerMN domain-containing protein [Acidimicrobiia bacterium]|nr:GerMN domain-containing protein [Acidimicrobiia bacterium]
MRRALALTLVAGALVGACGIGADDDLQQIDSAELLGLDQTSTSTTTTTAPTTTSTTTIPSTAPASSTTVAEAPTTLGVTTTTIATEPVDLYFLDGMNLVSVPLGLSGDVSPSRVMLALGDGPPTGDAGLGLDTEVPRGLIVTAVEAEGVVSVDLDGELFDPDVIDQRRAIGQIVLTLTGLRGVGQVRFTLDGTPLRVPKRDDQLSEPGEPVSREDYASLLDASPDSVPTSPPSTTSTPPTTDNPPTTPASTTGPPTTVE